MLRLESESWAYTRPNEDFLSGLTAPRRATYDIPAIFPKENPCAFHAIALRWIVMNVNILERRK